ncbi:MAG: hypothetical protein OCC49_16180 [Fibrobacterales bacterium]
MPEISSKREILTFLLPLISFWVIVHYTISYLWYSQIFAHYGVPLFPTLSMYDFSFGFISVNIHLLPMIGNLLFLYGVAVVFSKLDGRIKEPGLSRFETFVGDKIKIIFRMLPDSVQLTLNNKWRRAKMWVFGIIWAGFVSLIAWYALQKILAISTFTAQMGVYLGLCALAIAARYVRKYSISFVLFCMLVFGIWVHLLITEAVDGVISKSSDRSMTHTSVVSFRYKSKVITTSDSLQVFYYNDRYLLTIGADNRVERLDMGDVDLVVYGGER